MARARGKRPKPGGTTLREVHRSLQKGWPAGLTVLSGDDLFHLDAAYGAVVATLVPEDGTDFALSVFAEGRIDTADLVAAARSISMFTPNRVVAVRDAGIIEGDPKPLAVYAKDPPPNSYLLVRAGKLDLRRPLHKTLAKGGKFFQFDAVMRPQDAGEVQEMGKERGLKVSREVASFLLDASAGDLYRVSSELDKVDVWLGDGSSRTVTMDVAREVVCHGGVLSGWEVANAILERDEKVALAAVRKLIDSGEEPIRTIGGLAWRARTMIQAKALLEKGRPKSEAVAAAQAWRREDELFRALSRYTLEELMTFPAHLLEADRSLKSRSLDPTSVLETLVRSLITPRVRPANGDGGREGVRRL